MKNYSSLTKPELNRLLKSKEASIDRLNQGLLAAWEDDWQMVGFHICGIFLAIILLKLCQKKSPKLVPAAPTPDPSKNAQKKVVKGKKVKHE